MSRLQATIRAHGPALAAYFLLAALLTWPLVLNLGRAYPSTVPWHGGDPNMYIWWLDWISKALTGRLPVEPGLMLFWPQGVDVLAGYDGPLMLLVGLPLTLLSGNPVLAYDLFLLLTLVFAATATYALVWRLASSRYAAFLAGLIFGFSPYLLIRGTQHPNLLMIGTVPLLALALVGFCRRPSGKRAAWLGGAALLNALSSWYYAIGGLVLLIVALIYWRRELWAKVRPALAGLVAFGLGNLLPALPLLLSETGGSRPFGQEFVRQLGAQPWNFVLPNPLMNLFGAQTQALFDRFPRVDWTGPYMLEYTSYFGLLLLGLVIFGWVRRQKIKLPQPGFWLSLTAVFTVMAMGLELRLGDLALPLPFALLQPIFPFSLARVPNRFFVFALLAAAVIGAVAVVWLRRRIRRRGLRTLFDVAVVGLLLAERLLLPYPLIETTVPDFYRTVAADQEIYAIADIPLNFPGFSEYDYYQITHGQPIVTGEFFYPAYAPRVHEFILNNPLLSHSICERDAPADLPGRAQKEEALEQLAEANVRYVVVHNLNFVSEPMCARPKQYIRAFFGGDVPVFTDGEITVYEVLTPENL